MSKIRTTIFRKRKGKLLNSKHFLVSEEALEFAQHKSVTDEAASTDMAAVSKYPEKLKMINAVGSPAEQVYNFEIALLF